MHQRAPLPALWFLPGFGQKEAPIDIPESGDGWKQRSEEGEFGTFIPLGPSSPSTASGAIALLLDSSNCPSTDLGLVMVMAFLPVLLALW